MHKMHSSWDFFPLTLNPACSLFASLSYLIFIVQSVLSSRKLYSSQDDCGSSGSQCVSAMFLRFLFIHVGLFGPCLGCFNLYYCLYQSSVFNVKSGWTRSFPEAASEVTKAMVNLWRDVNGHMLLDCDFENEKDVNVFFQASDRQMC